MKIRRDNREWEMTSEGGRRPKFHWSFPSCLAFTPVQSPSDIWRTAQGPGRESSRKPGNIIIINHQNWPCWETLSRPLADVSKVLARSENDFPLPNAIISAYPASPFPFPLFFYDFSRHLLSDLFKGPRGEAMMCVCAYISLQAGSISALR